MTNDKLIVSQLSTCEPLRTSNHPFLVGNSNLGSRPKTGASHIVGEWPDANARETFIREIHTNFSLIAPAGVGKTHSIVQRVLEIARHDAENMLPRLVVVTYTRRAAAEMRNRVYAELLAQGVSPCVFEAMDGAFFGTIHAFCAKLLQSYGFYIGLPTILEPVPDEVRLWKTFLFSSEGEFAVEMAAKELGLATRYLWIQDLLQDAPPNRIFTESCDPDPPAPDFSALLSSERIHEARANSHRQIREGQRLVAQWLEKFNSNLNFLPLPNFSKGGKRFLAAWKQAFAPIRNWIRERIQCFHHAIALRYQQWRLEQGQLLYSDQITFTAQLLQHHKAGAILRQQNLFVILDEAQDTDPLQFKVLFEISNGSVSMVGDPQQSIYGDRADLRVYQQFHQSLCESPQGRELYYHVTFRCRPSILDFVNRIGPTLLNGKDGQVKFVPLQSACQGDFGQVVRVPIDPKGDGKVALGRATSRVAESIAAWLHKVGFEGLQARDWSEVAILCPRKRWLEILAIFLRRKNFSVQIQSENALLGDSPIHAWWTSLFWVLTHPTDSYEVAGLLRETFAIQDTELAAFCAGDAARLHAEVSSPLPTLRLLGSLAEAVKEIPLRTAVDLALRETCLLERLLSLPGEDPIALQARHTELLIQASDAEVRGLMLRDFAQELREHFDHPSDSSQVRRGAVQLITCQKAKGLEWDAVVVPYLHRKISFRTAAWEADPETRIQEMQRLFYVTLTRARNTLIFMDDSAYFSSREQTKTFSFAQILGDEGLRVLSGLPNEITAATYSSLNSSEIYEPQTSSYSWLEAARKAALHFPRKIAPHSLAHGSSSPNEETTMKTAGLDYGIWWHEAAQALPLHEPHWILHLEKVLQKCPDVERGRLEWELFSRTPLAARLTSGDYRVLREVPLFVPEKNTIIEGVMDLLALHHTKNTWLLLDWKTDQASASELLYRYRGQLEAYARCLHAFTGKKVEAGLYNVPLGRWIALE